MKLKYSLLLAALAASLFGVPAMAASLATSSSGSTASGTANNQGIGTSSSGSYSGSSAGSMANGGTGMGIGTGGTGGYAGADVNVTYNGDPGGSAGGDPPSTQTERLITTGTAIAPSIYSNNVCALSASAAGGFLGGAFALGFDRVDEGCDRRAWASLLGHYAEIYSIAAAHAPDAQTRVLALQEASVYAQWANNYICMQNPDLAAAAPPDAHFCHTVATQQGMQVVPAPVYATKPPNYATTPQVYAPPRPVVAVADPPPKPVYAGPHVYATHEVVPTSMRSGPVSGYQGPDYSDD